MKKIFMIMAMAIASLGYTACEPEVYDNAVWHIWQLKISAEKAYSTFYVGETLQLKAEITPDFATVTDVVWTSDNEAVATVSPSGLVTAVDAGNATITVCSEYNPDVKAAIKVKVSYKVAPIGLNDDDPIDQSEAEARRR